MKQVKEFLRVLFARKIAYFSVAVLLLFLICALFGEQLAPYDPNQVDITSIKADPSWEHPLGTDEVGRDILSRIIVGAEITLQIALVSVLVAGVVGCTVGLIAGYFGGAVDAVIMRITEAMLCIPKVALAMTLTFAIGRGTFSLMLAIGISSVPAYIRLMRGQVLSIKNNDYIQAQRILGNKHRNIIFGEVFPNCISPLIVNATTNLGGSIITESTLSFLGCGVQPPNAAWGSMVEDGFGLIRVYPYLSIYPGIAILLVVLAFNLFGDCLRDALDPRISKSL